MNTGLVAGAAAIVIGLPLMVVLAVAGNDTPAAASTTVCTLPARTPAAAATGSAVPGIPATVDTPATTPAPPGATLSGAQVAAAQIIIGGARTLGLTDTDAHRAAVIAIMAARQESALRNEANPNVPESLTLPHEGVSDGKNLDSLGLFQQRPGVGTWGTTAQIMMPAHAAAAFYDALLTVPGWQTLPGWEAAQDVQVSDDATAYAAWGGFAADVVDALYDGSAAGLACATVPSGTGGAGTGGGLPPGVPATGLAAEIIAYAAAQEGKPYQWGASGPESFDCSGLVVAAFASVGIDLSGTRTSEAMWATLPRIPDAALEPGDLVFFNPGEDGVPGPGHVGIYAGNQTMIDATHPGDVVRVSLVAGFGIYVGAARALPGQTSGDPSPSEAGNVSAAPGSST